jgi:sugar phosphate isomerase/epimerase
LSAGHPIRAYLGYSECSARTPAHEAAQKCLGYGLSAIQLTGDFPINFPENLSSAERTLTKEFILSNNLRLHFHAPHDIPLASRHEQIRQGGIARLKEYLQLAIDLGARSFVIHPGRFAIYKISSEKLILTDKNIPRVYLDRFFDSVANIQRFADGRIQILLENTYGFPPDLVEYVDIFLQNPGGGLVWDIVHGSHGQKQSREETAKFFSERLKNVKLIHLHDFSQSKGHQALGSGKLDINTYLDIISELQVDAIIEVLTAEDLRQSLDYIDAAAAKGSSG